MIRRRLPWVNQPTIGSGVNPKWIQRGLVALFDTRQARELISGDFASNKSSLLVPATYGLAADFSSTANQQYAHRPAYAITGDLSIVVYCEIDTITNYTHFISKQATTTTQTPYEVRCGQASPTAGEITLIRSNTDYRQKATASSVLSAGYKGLIAVTKQGAMESATANAYLGVTKYAMSGDGGTSTGSPTDSGSSTVWIARRYDGVTQLDGRIYYIALFNRELAASEIKEIDNSKWDFYAPLDRKVFVSVASSGITGTFSVTESVDVPAISGLVNHTGSLAVTESSDIASISGSIAHLGNLSVTESSDTFAASGTVSGSATITGSLALTEISDTASLIGKVAHTGALVVTETADTVSFNGLVAHTGALAVTESADVVAITGGSQITITGSIAITESPDVADFRGPSANIFSQEVEFRRYYVRKGKKILLFDSVDEAEEYIKAEQVAEEAIAKAKVSSRQERRKIKKRIIKDVLPAESIDTDWLAEMMQRFAINFDLPKLLAEQDYNRVMEIHAMAKAMQDDEDDIEMLLMWG